MRVPRRVTVTILLMALSQLTAIGCRTSTGGGSSNAAFLTAARDARVSVRTEEIVTATSGTHTFGIAPITTWESTPATALRSGVDIAFVYLSTPTETVGEGYYTLRASSDVTKTGSLPSTIQFIDRNGSVAGKLTATAEVHSLTIPEEASTRRTFVTVRQDPRPGVSNIPKIGPIRVIVLCCPNGECFYFILL